MPVIYFIYLFFNFLILLLLAFSKGKSIFAGTAHQYSWTGLQVSFINNNDNRNSFECELNHPPRDWLIDRPSLDVALPVCLFLVPEYS